jgi:hypothetical protein
MSPNDIATIPVLPNGMSHNGLAKFGYHLMTDRDKAKWDNRASEMPFSLHALRRLQWCRPSPTMYSSSFRWVHPELNRPLTVGELTTIMGWPIIPVGLKPIAQMAKGVCPEVGQWLAQQIALSLNGHWGSDDWESSFDDNDAKWVGGDTTGQLEKTFDLTKYCGKMFNEEKYRDAGVLVPKHRLNIDENGKLVKPWREIAQCSEA